MWMEQDPDATILFADVDGDGAEDLSITLLGVSDLDLNSVLL